MSASITVTTQIQGDDRIITCVVNNGADIPQDIFLYENNEGVPGAFFAVCALADYQRFQTYVGTPIPVFANKYLKQASGIKTLSAADPSYTEVAPAFVENCKSFRTQYLAAAAPASQTYTL